MKSPLYFDWSVSLLFGWGVYGLNLLRHWPRVSGSPAFCIGQIQLEGLGGLDPLSLRALANSLLESDQLRVTLATAPKPHPPLDGLVLHSLGNSMSGSTAPRSGGITGSNGTAAAIFFENTYLPNAMEISRDYSVIIAGSSWGEQVLRDRGVTNVATVIQGVDPSLFFPAPRGDMLTGRFAVFSGGKIERRKGQDIVLLAFRAFAARHPEAVLVTAWHSPWPIAALTVNENPKIQPIGLTPDGKCDIAGWAEANGVAPHQFIDLGPIPNYQMARVIREMDVAVFPNRCEGGTNLVAMECMACGVPTILSNNTGHLDLTATRGCFPLTQQAPYPSSDPGFGTDGWGNSDIDEIVEQLESVWRDRAEAARRAAIGAEAMHRMSWHAQIGKLHDCLAGYHG